MRTKGIKALSAVLLICVSIGCGQKTHKSALSSAASPRLNYDLTTIVYAGAVGFNYRSYFGGFDDVIFKEDLGYVATDPAPGLQPVYVCTSAPGLIDEFFTLQENCDGQVRVQDAEEGGDIPFNKFFIFSNPGENRKPLYGCTQGTDRYASNSINCDGQGNTGLLGYTSTVDQG